MLTLDFVGHCHRSMGNGGCLTRSLCSSLDIVGDIFVVPTNMKNIPSRMERLFSTTDAIVSRFSLEFCGCEGFFQRSARCVRPRRLSTANARRGEKPENVARCGHNVGFDVSLFFRLCTGKFW